MTEEIQPGLFGNDLPSEVLPAPAVKPLAAGVARVLWPNRAQVELRL